MTPDAIRTAWREIEALTNAASFLMSHADCQGPLAHLLTADPAVRVVMSARRHLLRRAKVLRSAILDRPTCAGLSFQETR